MTDFEAEIRSRIDAFVAELSELIRQSAVEAAVNALKATTSAGARRAGTGRPPTTRRQTPPAAAPKAGRRTRRGARRSQREIERTAERILGHVKANPGQRSEVIRKELKLERPEMADAAKRLITAKLLKAEGERRATTYSAA